jgi:hypothetical protein
MCSYGLNLLSKIVLVNFLEVGQDLGMGGLGRCSVLFLAEIICLSKLPCSLTYCASGCNSYGVVSHLQSCVVAVMFSQSLYETCCDDYSQIINIERWVDPCDYNQSETSKHPSMVCFRK